MAPLVDDMVRSYPRSYEYSFSLMVPLGMGRTHHSSCSACSVPSGNSVSEPTGGSWRGWEIVHILFERIFPLCDRGGKTLYL